MTGNGRISIAGLTSANVDYVADAIKDVVENY
jgi:aspartate/tyrosine/aromatic aminotransferase